MRTTRNSPGRFVALSGGASARPLGRVRLVGAGPGDPELLTLKAVRALSEADVVVHDRLIPQAVLDYARPGARLIYVGKRKSHHSVPQDGINDLLVAFAREGLETVRLKAGDPFVFGRGGEELAACRAAGVPCEVVPGVSAGLAAAASAGAAVTHRGLAQAVTFVTGHAAGAGGEPDLDWAALARGNQTVVVYMGLSTAPVVAARLVEAGCSGSTPVLVVENASRPEERRVLTTLADLGEAAAGLDGPAVLIIGEVAAMADVGALSVREFPPLPSSSTPSSSGLSRGPTVGPAPISAVESAVALSNFNFHARPGVGPRDKPEDDGIEVERARA